MATPGCVRNLLERKCHPHELVVVPRAPEQLNVDRLSVVVVADWKHDGGNSVCRTWRVAAAEARFAAASIVEADVAQEPGVDDGVDAQMVGAGGVHPQLRGRLAPSPIVAERLYLRCRQSRRRRRQAAARIGAN